MEAWTRIGWKSIGLGEREAGDGWVRKVQTIVC